MKVIGLIGKSYTPAHDPAVAAMENGKLIFALEEERITRRKKATGLFPMNSLNACLDYCGWTASDVDALAIGWDFCDDHSYPKNKAIKENLPKLLLDLFPEEKIHFINHHLAHAYSSWYFSDGSPALSLVCDGRGEKNSIAAFYLSKEAEPVIVHQGGIKRSFGMFYESAAGYCSLGYLSAGKLMGLASYGNSNAGSLTVDEILEGSSHFSGIDEKGFENNISVNLFEAWQKEFSERYHPFCRKESGTTIMAYANFANAAQTILENSVFKTLDSLQNECSSQNLAYKNLCLSGGVFLNCSMNGLILKKNPDKQIVICPASGDSGAAIGAAVAAQLNYKKPVEFGHKGVSLGLSFSKNDIIENGSMYNLSPDSLDCGPEKIADDLASGKIILWYYGRDEFGPRALGNRCILADPGKYDSRNRLNKIKCREKWRPLAPILMEEEFSNLFESEYNKPLMQYMLSTAIVRKEQRKRVPAIVHADGTSRPQIIDNKINNPIYEVLKVMKSKYDCPCLINTSLNTMCEPIAHSPEDLFKIYFQIDADVSAYLNGVYYTK